ncbi:hypothetical protein D3C78_304620 [compost metagenome]
MADETIGLIPVGGGLGEAVGAHHIDDVGAGALADFCELAVGCRASRFVAGVLEGGLQDGQASENGGEIFIAVQCAQQVGDVEVEGLTVLLGELLAVVALGEVVEGPE